MNSDYSCSGIYVYIPAHPTICMSCPELLVPASHDERARIVSCGQKVARLSVAAQCGVVVRIDWNAHQPMVGGM